MQFWNWLQHIDALDKKRMLVVKRDRMPDLAVLYFDDFLELVRGE